MSATVGHIATRLVKRFAVQPAYTEDATTRTRGRFAMINHRLLNRVQRRRVARFVNQGAM